jgi:predicted metal-binding membrane protein
LLAASLTAGAILGSGDRLLNLSSFCAAAGPSLGLEWQEVESSLRLNSPEGLLASWTLMVVAMMAPLAARPLDYVWERSLARRRPRAAMFLLAGYILPWVAFGLLALPVAAFAHALSATSGMLPLLLMAAIAFVWQASPWKQHSLNRCHSLVPLAAFGAPADRDALLFGVRQGGWCVASCCVIMILPFAVGDAHLPLMALLAVFAFVERLEPPRPARWRLSAPRFRRAKVMLGLSEAVAAVGILAGGQR